MLRHTLRCKILGFEVDPAPPVQPRTPEFCITKYVPVTSRQKAVFHNFLGCWLILHMCSLRCAVGFFLPR